MISAVDTNILLDILTASPEHGEFSYALIQKMHRKGPLVVSDIVYAELGTVFKGNQKLLESFISDLNISLVFSTKESLCLAGSMWWKYRKAGGKRERILPDFVVASHAQVLCDALLSRNRGFYRKWFSDLEILEH